MTNNRSGETRQAPKNDAQRQFQEALARTEALLKKIREQKQAARPDDEDSDDWDSHFETDLGGEQ